jgi:hypothetical protein
LTVLARGEGSGSVSGVASADASVEATAAARECESSGNEGSLAAGGTTTGECFGATGSEGAEGEGANGDGGLTGGSSGIAVGNPRGTLTSRGDLEQVAQRTQQERRASFQAQVHVRSSVSVSRVIGYDKVTVAAIACAPASRGDADLH